MVLQTNFSLQFNRYNIIRVLGQGGFGITYLAYNVLLGRKVAIKEFFPKDFCGRNSASHLMLGTQSNAETVTRLKDRFLKEAKNIAKLDHPGIIKIHDVFEENNTAYYVMDYVDGESLNELVKREGFLSEVRALEYIRKIGDALDYIHSRNMTHFDVKPANVMVRRSDNQPILIDFGLSKQYDLHGDATSTLMQGVSHGYSPIELYNAGAINSFSPQTDIYSLAATLLFLLTGKVPPSALEIAENGLLFPSTVSDKNKSAIEKALQLSRSKRPQHVISFLNSLTISHSNDRYNPEQEDTRLFEDSQNTSTKKASKPTSSSSHFVAKRISWVSFLPFGILILVVGMIGRIFSSDNYDIAVASDTVAVVEEEVVVIPVETSYDSVVMESVLNSKRAKQEYDVNRLDVNQKDVLTDTIRRGYLIHDMAKRHFGSKDFWVYIYEENKEKIVNPNNMRGGEILVIPPANKYDIDPNNPESLRKARRIAGEVLRRFGYIPSKN